MITEHEPVRVAPNVWRFSWASDLEDPTFYIYVNGKKVSTTKETTHTLRVEDGESAVVEVFDDESAPVGTVSGRAVLQWRRTPATEFYKIEEYVSGQWVERTRVRDSGSAYSKYRTRFLEDVSIHQFRVTPTGTNGNAGTSISFSFFMVRNPDPPVVTFSYDNETNAITIEEV